jgi:hypothetical protein
MAQSVAAEWPCRGRIEVLVSDSGPEHINRFDRFSIERAFDSAPIPIREIPGIAWSTRPARRA